MNKNYKIEIDLALNYDFHLYLYKDLIGAKIPIVFDGVIGAIEFPDLVKNKQDVFYSTLKTTVGYFQVEDNVFACNRFYCFIESETDLTKTFINKFNDQVEKILQIIDQYKFGIYKKLENDESYIPRTDCYLMNILTKEKFTSDSISNCISNIIDTGISKRMLSCILAISIKNYKFDIKHSLIIEAYTLLSHIKYRQCIINCCTVVEILISEQIIKKLTSNGAKEKDAEIIVTKISGIVSLVKLAKALGVIFPKKFDKPSGFEYQKLAKLRNHSAHRGIDPSYDDCIKYIEGVKRLLMFYKVKFISFS